MGRPGTSSYHTPEGLQIGACRFFPDLLRLETPDGRRKLSPKAAGVLALLAANPGRVLRRDDIIDQVWPAQFPTDDVLTHSITDLRRALGDDPVQPRYIETIPRVGYRLMEAVQPVSPAGKRRTRGLLAVAVVMVLAAVAWFLAQKDSRLRSEAPAADAGDPAPPVTIRSTAVVIATPEAREWEGAADPAGRRIAYSRLAEGNRDLWLLDRDSGRVLPLVESPDANEAMPAWSPRGDALAFRSTRADDCQVWRYDFDAERAVPIADGCYGRTTLDWSPDGDWIVYTAEAAEDAANLRNLAIHRVPVLGGVPERITFSPTATRHDVHPRFSPDGMRLAFIRTGSESKRLLMVQAVDARLATPVVTDSWITSFDWHHRNLIFMTAHRDQLDQLEVLDLASRRVFGLGRSGVADVSVAGDELIVHPFDAGVDIRWLEDDAEGLAVSSRGYNFHVAVSPDGTRLAYCSTRSGRTELYVETLGDGEGPVQLTDRPGAGPAHPRWHPDGRHLAFLLHNDKGSRIAMADTVDREVYPFPVFGGESLMDIDWSPQGDALYVTANRTQRWELWRVDGRTGVPEQLTTQGAEHFSVDRDGTVYFTRPGEAALHALSPNGTITEVNAEAPAGSPSNWLVREAIIHVATDSDPPRWVRYPLGDGQETIRLPRQRLNLALEPTGRRVYYERGSVTRADLEILTLDWR